MDMVVPAIYDLIDWWFS